MTVMKLNKILAVWLACLLLSGCAGETPNVPPVSTPQESMPTSTILQYRPGEKIWMISSTQAASTPQPMLSRKCAPQLRVSIPNNQLKTTPNAQNSEKCAILRKINIAMSDSSERNGSSV